MRRAAHAATLFALVGALACSDDSTGPDDTPCTDDTGTVEATVTVAGSVVFDWSPACAVAMLLVEEEASDMWLVSTPESSWDSPSTANRIVPPVVYGQTPEGDFDSDGPLPLVPGTTYELILWRILPEGSEATCLLRLEEACLMVVETFVR